MSTFEGCVLQILLWRAGDCRTVALSMWKLYRRTMGAWRLQITSSKKAAAERVGVESRGENKTSIFQGGDNCVSVPCEFSGIYCSIMAELCGYVSSLEFGMLNCCVYVLFIFWKIILDYPSFCCTVSTTSVYQTTVC